MQLYTVYVIWKMLYTFRVVPPPIIRSANNCIYSIWYLSHRYCYLHSINGVLGTCLDFLPCSLKECEKTHKFHLYRMSEHSYTQEER